jgi:archaemetzincin
VSLYSRYMRWIACLLLVTAMGCKSTKDTVADTDRSRRGAATTRRGRATTCMPTRAGRAPMRPGRDQPMTSRDLREGAIGQTRDLPAPLRRAFDPAPFSPLPRPGPHDWLANHPEPGQPFPRFVAARPTLPGGKRRRIDLLPLGEFTGEGTPQPAVLAEYAQIFFGLESRLLPPARLADLSITSRVNRDTGKRQYLSPEILDALDQRLRPDAYCLLAITMEDLYPEPTWNFVFGQASPSHRVGVYSFARYDPAFHGEPRSKGYQRAMLRRSLNVMVHEVGHMFGLEHCIYFRCVLNGSNHLAEADARPMHLCPVCLRKLHHAVGFDPSARYRKLAQFYRRHGLADQARFVAQRIREIDGR